MFLQVKKERYMIVFYDFHSGISRYRPRMDFYSMNSIKIVLLLLGTIMSKSVDAKFFEFPKSTGSFAVGVTSIHMKDQDRKESYNPGSDEPRELMVTAWYPAEGAQDLLSPYAPGYLLDSLKNLFKSFKGITDEDLLEVDSIRVHAAPDAPIAKAQGAFPLIVFSHGYYGSRFYCSALCEELASHGYVVIAIDHTYDCGITQFPYGKIVSWKSLTDANQDTDEFYATFRSRITVRVEDIRFVLDAVARKTHPLFAHVDASIIGAFGHSLGGEAVLQAAVSDKRIKTVAAMDGFPVGPMLPVAGFVPTMLFLAERTDWGKLECSEQVRTEISKNIAAYEQLCAYKIFLKDADHIVFSDFALFHQMNLFKKLPREGHMFSIGPVDGLKEIELIRAYLVDFFDKELKGKRTQLLKNNLQDEYNKLVVK